MEQAFIATVLLWLLLLEACNCNSKSIDRQPSWLKQHEIATKKKRNVKVTLKLSLSKPPFSTLGWMPIEWMPVPEDDSLTSSLPPVMEGSWGVCSFSSGDGAARGPWWQSWLQYMQPSPHVLKIRLLNALSLENFSKNAAWNIHFEDQALARLKCISRCAVQWLRIDPGNERNSAGKWGSERSSVHSSATVTKSWTSAYPRELNTEGRVTEGFLIWFSYLEMSPNWCGNNWKCGKRNFWTQRQQRHLSVSTHQQSDSSLASIFKSV